MSESNYPDCSGWWDDKDDGVHELERIYPIEHGPVCKGHLRVKWTSMRPDHYWMLSPTAPKWGLDVLEEYL